jgi:hypothetical protein
MHTTKSPGRVGARAEASALQIVPNYTSPASAGEGEIDGSPPALIPPGEYRLRFLHWHTGVYFGRAAKVTAWFSVMDQGVAFQARLPRHYNVRKLKGKQGRNGGFVAGWHSDLMREYATLAGMSNRNDRIVLARFSSLLLIGKVETVNSTYSQGELAPALQYSVIRKLLRVEAGRLT